MPGEPLVYDGFETFELSQYWPAHLNTVVGADEHKAYPRALRGLLDRRFRLEQTSSRRPRVPGNPLQPVNHLHALMRHSGANFKRETLAWSKRRQSMVWRDCLFRVWRNWVKRTAERGSGGEDQPRGSLCQVSGTILVGTSYSFQYSATSGDGVATLVSHSWWIARVAPTCSSRRAAAVSGNCAASTSTRIT